MSPVRPCPPPLLFRTLLDGMLSAAEESQLTGHVDVCAHCQQELERLSRTLQEGLRLDQPAPPAPLDDSLRRAMQSLKMSSLGDLRTTDFRAEERAVAVVPPELPCEGWLGPYEIKEIIGRGGMGVVLKAFDPSLYRLVALKVLSPHLADSIAARKRFAREGRAAAAVNHEHVVAVYGVHESDGLPFLVMEYVPGISLQDRLDQDGPLDESAIVRLGMQTAAGLAAAHARGLIHRDIKPANILLEHGSGRVKITDFGLARAADDASLTRSNVIAGTPMYMAPEQARGEAVDARADLFSLGSVLYAACTGRPPFRASSAVAVLHRICTVEPPPLRELNPDISGWLCSFIAILHAKDRAERFRSAAEAAELLAHYLAHLEQPARQPKPPRLTHRLARPRGLRPRRRLRLLAFAALLMLVMLLTRFLFRIAPAPSDDPSRPSAPNAALSSSPPSLRGHLAHQAPVLFAAFSPDGKRLATACQDHVVRIWDRDSGKVRRELFGHRTCVWSVAFSPDGRTLASASGEWEQSSQSGELRVWDLDTGELLRSLDGAADLIFSVAISPDGLTVAAAGWDRTIRLWDLKTGKQRAILRGHTKPIRFLSFASDGQTLASAGFDGRVKLWDLATEDCFVTFSDLEYRINALAFSPDGKLLAAAENPCTEPPDARIGRVKLWDLTTYREHVVLNGHRGRALSVCFAPDGKTLVTGGGDWDRFGEVLLWNTATWAEPIRLHGYNAWVECVVFSPDRRLLVSTGGATHLQGEVKLWNWPRR
ncbi:MAG TPA: serine/threonine-protein kinase [Gemmataceae bacterium]|jgi:WD40 repeat protein/tRNA A-37 threonylcarbamoyl transferase component Bud32